MAQGWEEGTQPLLDDHTTHKVTQVTHPNSKGTAHRDQLAAVLRPDASDMHKHMRIVDVVGSHWAGGRPFEKQ